jgi:hypothetical protein
LESEPEKPNYIKLLPENLFVALDCCLEDKHERVALAAAIALYTLERPNEKVTISDFMYVFHLNLSLMF